MRNDPTVFVCRQGLQPNAFAIVCKFISQQRHNERNVEPEFKLPGRSLDRTLVRIATLGHLALKL